MDLKVHFTNYLFAIVDDNCPFVRKLYLTKILEVLSGSQCGRKLKFALTWNIFRENDIQCDILCVLCIENVDLT